ncbi:MAG: hypothetical protein RIF33_04960 [Cyclobacteriaceae bacterium]
MKGFLLILTVVIAAHSHAQPRKLAKYLYTLEADSTLLSVYQVATREMVKTESEVLERLLSVRGISKDEAENILKKASRKSAYRDDRALLTHYNIVIGYYKNGEPFGSLTLSSKTGNITISIAKSQTQAYGRVSKSFGKYLVSVLDNYGMLKFINRLDLEGFN